VRECVSAGVRKKRRMERRRLQPGFLRASSLPPRPPRPPRGAFRRTCLHDERYRIRKRMGLTRRARRTRRLLVPFPLDSSGSLIPFPIVHCALGVLLQASRGGRGGRGEKNKGRFLRVLPSSAPIGGSGRNRAPVDAARAGVGRRERSRGGSAAGCTSAFFGRDADRQLTVGSAGEPVDWITRCAICRTMDPVRNRGEAAGLRALRRTALVDAARARRCRRALVRPSSIPAEDRATAGHRW
jgi:hypothetical protein